AEEGVSMGAPKEPMPEAIARAIAEAVAQVPGIFEAHLPERFTKSSQERQQVLVIALTEASEIPRIMQELTEKLQGALGPIGGIDVIPFPPGEMLDLVRKAGCQIFPTKKKPWWKLW